MKKNKINSEKSNINKDITYEENDDNKKKNFNNINFKKENQINDKFSSNIITELNDDNFKMKSQNENEKLKDNKMEIKEKKKKEKENEKKREKEKEKEKKKEKVNENENENKKEKEKEKVNENENENENEKENENENESESESENESKNKNKNKNEAEENEKKEEQKKGGKEEEKNEMDKEVYVKRIINVEITIEIKNFIKTFMENREEIINWCIKNNFLYSNKVNEKTTDIIFNDSKYIDKIINEKSINIDILSVLIYFYNLYCTHNNKKKINFHNIMYDSCITYRGIYENIDKNSKSFKNLLKEERKYKKIMGSENKINDFFFNYKKAFPYGINLILGLFLTFMSGYYGCLLLGYTNFTTRLICGILFSYITLIVEVIIFIIINEKIEHFNKNKKCINGNNGLYEKVCLKQEQHDLGNTSEIKEINKQSTLKKRRKT